MTYKSKKQSEHPQKSVLSIESQRLLEEIFAFFYNQEEAKNDSDLCLEAMLTEICNDLRDRPISATLQDTLDKACVSTAPAIIREEKQSVKTI